MPVLIFLLLDHLDPVVGDAHGQAVVEAHAAILELRGDSRHTAHLLGDGYRLRVNLMDKYVGKCEVDKSVGILTAVVVVAIAAECLAETMVVVEHGGDAVEAETVELVLVEPEFAVGEQEVEHAVLAVVEAERIPCRVLAARVTVEVEVIAAVEASQSLKLVLDRMGMHYVHDDGDSHLVGIVDELF